MNFSRIKNKKILKRTERLLKNKQRKHSFLESKNIKTVGIIVDESSDFNFEMLKALQKQITSASNNFLVLTCRSANTNFNEFRGVLFTENGLTWNGKIKSTEVKNFIEQPFDMLIDYSEAENIYSKYFVAKSNATFKVGFANIDTRLYDFMVDANNDIKSFNKELIKYLKILNKL